MTQRYTWQFNGPPQEIELKRVTKMFYVFTYPQNSKMAGQDWRMSKDTFSAYQAKGVITVESEAQS